MIRSIAVFALAVAAAHAGVGSAEAQVVRGGFGGPRVFAGPGGPVALTPGYGYSSTYVAPTYAPTTAPGYVAPYSYYVLPSTVPSRTYLGPNVFPFYGHPYGRTNDRWTWPYMSGDGGGVLARYYYPPLG